MTDFLTESQDHSQLAESSITMMVPILSTRLGTLKDFGTSHVHPTTQRVEPCGMPASGPDSQQRNTSRHALNKPKPELSPEQNLAATSESAEINVLNQLTTAGAKIALHKGQWCRTKVNYVGLLNG